MRLPTKCQCRDLSAANLCLLRIGPGAGALAELFVGKTEPELLFPSLLNLQRLSPFGLRRGDTKVLSWLTQRRGSLVWLFLLSSDFFGFGSGPGSEVLSLTDVTCW